MKKLQITKIHNFLAFSSKYLDMNIFILLGRKESFFVFFQTFINYKNIILKRSIVKVISLGINDLRQSFW